VNAVAVLGGLGVVVLVLVVLSLITLGLWQSRSRWPDHESLLSVWGSACLAAAGATTLLVGFLPLAPDTSSFVVDLLADDGGGAWIPMPGLSRFVGVWLAATVLGFLVWCPAVWISAGVSGLRGSLRAQLGMAATLTLGLMWGVSALPIAALASFLVPEVYRPLIVLPVVLLGATELALLKTLMSMSRTAQQATSL
jgi:hypothetical protein